MIPVNFFVIVNIRGNYEKQKYMLVANKYKKSEIFGALT